MTMPKIKQALEQLKTAPFPDFPEDDALSDWVGELAEFDGYVVGLATSLVGGGQVDLLRMNEQVRDFRSIFEQLPATYPVSGDSKIHAACKQYLKLIEDIVAAINEHRN